MAERRTQQGRAWERERERLDAEQERRGYGQDYGRESREWEQARPDYERERRGYGQDYGRESQAWERQEQPWGRQAYSRGEEGYGRGLHAGRGPKGYVRSDVRIREDICDRLTEHPYIDASELEVEVTEAEVTLKGTVEDRNAKRIAEDIAEAVAGVTEVHNQLRVSQGRQSGHAQGQQNGRSQSTPQGRAGQTAG
ncbi:MAG: BON domain-containing protein [Candidatus Tectimicrobiota bacterium]